MPFFWANIIKQCLGLLKNYKECTFCFFWDSACDYFLKRLLIFKVLTDAYFLGTLNVSRRCLMFATDCHHYSYMIEHLWARHCALHKLSLEELQQPRRVEIIASFTRWGQKLKEICQRHTAVWWHWPHISAPVPMLPHLQGYKNSPASIWHA